jgi:hypothetical protein
VADESAPSAWLLSNADLIPRAGRAHDVACGRGRHAPVLAARGLQVRAVERDPDAIARHGRPTNPDFLLHHGELRERLAALTILRERDGLFEGRHVAGVVARKP